MNRKFSVIGAGNLGTHLVSSLVNRGYQLKYIYKKSKYNAFVSAVTGDMGKLVRESDIVFICTRESGIRAAAESAAASFDPAGKIFFHTANSLTSAELLPLEQKGAYTASFSPLQTFASFLPERAAPVFKGVYFLAEGHEKALEAAGEIAADLEAKVLIVDKDKKIYFHIAAVCASNFLISLLKLSENQLKKVGIKKQLDLKVLLPLIKQTLANVESRGLDAALTGPVKRKETGIVDKHLEHLEGEEAALYKALSDFLVQSFS